MKNFKNLLILFVILVLTSCDYQGNISKKTQEEVIDTTEVRHLVDSLVYKNLPDINLSLENRIVEEEFKEGVVQDLKNYVKSLRGKQFIIIEDLKFKCKGIVGEKTAENVLVAFEYESDDNKLDRTTSFTGQKTSYEIRTHIILAAVIPVSEARSIVPNEYYRVKGKVNNINNMTWFYEEPWIEVSNYTYSSEITVGLGSVVITDVKFEKL